MKLSKTCSLIVAGLSLFTAVHATADTSSFTKHQDEIIGFGTGAAIGGAIANVPGAFAGGLIGALVSQLRHDTNELIALRAESSGTTVAMSDSYNMPATTIDSLKEGVTVDFNFRTASSDLTVRDSERLAEVAQFLKQFPQLQLQLDGYSDARGNADYNLDLSKSRLAAVKQQLVADGVEVSRIASVAHGKGSSVEKDQDGYAFERRVSIMLKPGNVQVAKHSQESESLA